MMIVMAVVFSTIFAQGRNGAVSPELYPLYLIVGNVTFSVMSESTNQALMSIIWASSLLKKVKVHRWVFPVQKVLFSLVNFGFSLIAVAIVMIWFHIVPTWHLILLPVCLFLLMLFCMGLGMMLSAPAGNDILFDDALCEQGRNFCNKIWNAFRLVKGWENGMGTIDIPADAHLAVQWFDQRLDAAAVEVADLFSKYRLSEALMAVYKLFWDEFSSWLLEIVKPAYGQPVNGFIYSMTLSAFERLLAMLHPFMPFITEELWQQLREREPGASLMVQPLGEPGEVNEEFLQQFETAKEIISSVRTIRLQKNIALKEPLELQVVGANPVEKMNPVIRKMCNLSAIEVVDAKADGASSFMIGTTEFAVPLGNMIDVDAEIARMEAELKHKEGFLQGVLKKLSNEKFVNNAPAAVIEMERKKQADAESIIQSLKESIASLKNV